MRKWCNRLLGCLVREGDTNEDVHVKRVFVPVCVFMSLFAGAATARTSLAEQYASAVGNGLIAFSHTVFIVGVALTTVPIRYLVDALLVVDTLGICIKDMSDAALLNPFRSLSFIVLALDAALVLNRDHVVLFIIPFTLVYSVAETIESMYRYGMYHDLGYWGAGFEGSMCNCASPPCGTSMIKGMVKFTSISSVLLVNFYLTRGFSNGMRLQLEKVRSSVEVAVEITAALAKYDVDTAEAAITHGEHLPEEMEVSFRQLLYNLRSYKAYLPHSCLVPREEGQVFDESCDDGSCCKSDMSPYPAWPEGSEHATSPPYGDLDVFSERRTVCSSEHSDPASSATDLSLGSTPREHVNTMLRAATRRARVSLAAGNMIGYLSSGDFAFEWIAADVEWWCSNVVDAKGVVDLIGGDRRYASFNARQACGEHASHAVQVVSSRGDMRGSSGKRLRQIVWTGCVVTGQAVCGDFGSASALRFMVLGAVSSSLHPFERMAAQWRTKVLADSEAYSAAC
eukprot:Hpha_TRINITY_DN15801_c4_g1::TRINITY_DN15801_c4_g1_i1::g.188208::m.188208